MSIGRQKSWTPSKSFPFDVLGHILELSLLSTGVDLSKYLGKPTFLGGNVLKTIDVKKLTPRIKMFKFQKITLKTRFYKNNKKRKNVSFTYMVTS